MSYNWKCCSFYPNNFDASALRSGYDNFLIFFRAFSDVFQSFFRYFSGLFLIFLRAFSDVFQSFFRCFLSFQKAPFISSSAPCVS